MLNEQQLKAVEEVNNPLIIVAGPGTGKTTVICSKIEYLMNKLSFKSSEILALTFTEKAADEMSNRVEFNTKTSFEAKTFHSFALDIIEEFYHMIPEIDKDFTLIDESDIMLFFYENINNFKLSSIEVSNNYSNLAYELKSTILKLKDFGITLLDLEKLEFENIQTKIDLMSAYSRYEQFKRKNNYLDFADLLIYVKSLLEKDNEVLELLKKRFKYILVDEFQDTNKIQLDIISLLSENNITVVGDQKQSIYSFRGSNYENLNLFKKNFKNYKTIYLNENYRSSMSILENINLIINNVGSEKEMLEGNLNEQGLVKLIECDDEFSQNSFIVEKINSILRTSPNKKIGILARRKSELYKISRELESNNISHHISDSESLFENDLVKEVMFVLTVISDPKQANSELFYLLSSTELRRQTVNRISRKSSMKDKSIYNVLKLDSDFSESINEKNVVRKLLNDIDKLIELSNSKAKLSDIVREIIILFKLYQRAEFSNDMKSINALSNLIRFSENFSKVYKNNDLNRFLEICEIARSINLSLENSTLDSNIELLTIHQSKGKEFDIVIVPFLNERRFPSTFKTPLFKSSFDIKREEFIEEEKRLFFVAVSRAKENLYLTYVKKFSENKTNSKKSILLDMLPNLTLEKCNLRSNSFDLTSREKVKLEIFDRIKKSIISNNFDLAKKDLNLLEQIFDKGSNLNSFIKEKHPDYHLYKQKLQDSEFEPVEFDTSSIVYSVSQIGTYDTCPKKYMYQYVYKVPSLSKHYFDFGISMHTVLELLVDDFNDPDITDEKLYTKAIELLNKNWVSKGYENSNQEKEYFEKAMNAIKDYISKEREIRQNTNREIIEKEGRFVIEFEGRKIQGYIDRIDKTSEGFEIIDYKTSNSMESEKGMEDNLQLYVYSEAIKNLHNTYPKYVSLWYLVHNEIRKVSFDAINTEDIRKNLLESIENIERKNFKATPSYIGCKFCDFNKICSSAKKSR